MNIGYDQGCYDLALTFISDSRIPAADHERLAEELAQSIQCEIELFLDDNEPEEES